MAMLNMSKSQKYIMHERDSMPHGSRADWSEVGQAHMTGTNGNIVAQKAHFSRYEKKLSHHNKNGGYLTA